MIHKSSASKEACREAKIGDRLNCSITDTGHACSV